MENKTELIRVKATPTMVEQIQDEAGRQRREFSDMVRILLTDGLAAQGHTLIDTPGQSGRGYNTTGAQ